MHMQQNRPEKITLISKKNNTHRSIRLLTSTGEKSFKYASINCHNWALKQGYPITFKVGYGIHKTHEEKMEEFMNEMDCNDIDELNMALQSLVKESFEKGSE